MLHGQPGFAIADRISKALPPPIAAKDIPLSGIFNPSHERYAEAAEVRTLAETDPEVGRIMEHRARAGGPGPQRRGARLRGDPLLGAAAGRHPAVEARRRLGHHRLGLPVVRGDRPAQDGLPGSAHPHRRRRRGRMRWRPTTASRSTTATLALDDKKTYELLSRGDTLGVFQLDGGGMRTLLKAMAPTHFGDIAAALALYRPGPMAANAHMDYAERSNGRQKITPIHPELEEALEPILGETYHLLVYQEQVMAIAQQLGGLQPGPGRPAAPRDGQEEEGDHREGVRGVPRGHARPRASRRSPARRSGTSCCPSRGTPSTSPTPPATGWSPTGRPISRPTTRSSSWPPSSRRSATTRTSRRSTSPSAGGWASRCSRRTSTTPTCGSRAVDGDIRFGLGAVRNVGANVVESIIETRKDKGRFTSFADFLEKVEPGLLQQAHSSSR